MLKGTEHHLTLCLNQARVVHFSTVYIMVSALAILGLVAFANAGLLPQQPTNLYLPPTNVNTYSSSAINSNVQGRQIAIVRQVNENNGDGSFVYSYETEDGQTAEARGQLQADGAEGVQATQGSYSFTAPDGVRYSVTYSAGLNGFEAQGAHLPVAPPVPEAILKALSDNAADEARGVYDDGSYREENTSGQRTNVGITQVYQQSQQGGYQQGVYQRNQQSQQGSYQQNQQGIYQQNLQNQQGGYQLPVPGRQLRF